MNKRAWILGLMAITVLLSMTACGNSTAEVEKQTEAPKSKPASTKVPKKPTATPKLRPIATKVSKMTSVATQPHVTDSRKATVFSTVSDYHQFPINLQKVFKNIVDTEFAAVQERAGISIAVYTDGALWTYASGKASESLEMTVDTPLMISSTSKTFLSPLILTQIESGFYKLSDSLETVLSGHPDFSSFPTDKINPKVTIEELLTMSSGLADFNKNAQGKSELSKKPEWTPAALINLIESQYVEPGSFEYNDTNVVLLGMIAEFHSGQQLAELYRQTFYEPLSITAITLPEEGTEWYSGMLKDPGDQLSIPTMAMPYADNSMWASGFGNMIDAAPFGFGYYIGAIGRNRYACCGIVSTPENMARWAYQLYSPNGSAVSESVRVQLKSSVSPKRIPPWSSSTMPGHTPAQYGYLVSKKAFLSPDGKELIATVYGHLGGGSGYSAWMHYSPELDLSISVLTNSQMNFFGTCRVETPGNCITIGIFKEYKEQLSPK